MERRACLAALVGGGLLAAGLPARRSGAGQAGKGCYRLGQGGVRCATGFVDTPDLPSAACRSHAWAACLAYVMRGFGARVELADLLARAGGAGCAPHDPRSDPARLHAMAGHWQDREGRRFLLGLAPLGSLHETHPDPEIFSRLLDRLSRQPLLCGAAGHTTVVTEITTRSPQPGNPWREAVTVRDPWPPGAGLRPLTDRELARPSWVLGVTLRPVSGA
ncbi:hypothetical protein DKT77_15180 [Meridianimarinicoccus roseus]|uniref:Uncharacterized protein n=1 Tax=Meridianimarinicoccus roseus TaxID=2072018 RepID=A0A2V2L8F5_9RHOB|nr:hypothetical protein [Meridianimarinicoccus roseus]PWR01485.1 hypothetical protein DKT77_15180 [Meridianimarinicoccus roseus]